MSESDSTLQKRSWGRVATAGALRLLNNLLMMCHSFVLSETLSKRVKSGRFPLFKKVWKCVCVCVRVPSFLSLTHFQTQKYSNISFPFLTALSFLSVLLKESSIHLIPLLVPLYWGWALLVFHVKGFLFYWTSNPLCLACRSLLLARCYAYSGAAQTLYKADWPSKIRDRGH